MRWDVALAPPLVRDVEGITCIVIDALRATSTLTALFEHGAQRVAIAETPDMALDWRTRLPDWKLAGERNSVRPEGFDTGNSPVEVAAAPSHQKWILATTNGTRALRACQNARLVLAGSLLNARASVARALAEGTDILVVCSGTRGGAAVTIEDVYVAGAMTAMATNGFERGDSALTALAVHEYYPRVAEVFRASGHGRSLIALGFADDLAYCAQRDVSKRVLELGEWQGMPVVRQTG